VTVQVAATLMSPPMSTALTEEPGTMGSGCFSVVTEPVPITGTTPAAANWGPK
jgi:hypothetical protein